MMSIKSFSTPKEDKKVLRQPCQSFRRVFLTALLLIPLFLCGAFQSPEEAIGQGIPPSLQISLTLQSGGLNSPVHITHAGDGSGRLFVVEQPGRIRIIENGVLLPTPFLDIANKVLFGGEQGLLSVAFPPLYAAKGYFYVNYTRIPDGATVVARYFIGPDINIANPDSEQVVLTVVQPFANHNGGQLAFGPDGSLYIGMGDGGSGGDPNNFAQNLNDLPGNQKLLGKLLRIDVESGIIPYAIPLSNPVLNNIRSEIWALGLRNPWRFSFDRLTGDLYVGDVGQNSFEEIDFQPAASTGGENYGWRIMEGLHCFNPPVCVSTGLTLPVAEYDHGSTQSCSVTGGMVYRGLDFQLMQGIYFYGDFCSGRIWGLKFDGAAWQSNLLLAAPINITTFGEDEAGEIYVVDYSFGRLYRIVGFSTQDIMNLVTKYYNDILGRAPEPGAAEFWRSQISSIIPLGIDIREGFQGLAKFFFDSQEYLQKNRDNNAFVTDLYQAFLNRAPDAPGLAFWLDQLAQGLTRDMLMTQFANSTEFGLFLQGLFGPLAARSENNLVNDLYRGFLNRFPDPVGFNFWLTQMRTAQCTGAQTVRDLSHQIASLFINSVEYELRNRNDSQYVEDLYNGILRRGADPGGFSFWVNTLSTLTRDQVLQAFTDSPEFQLRITEVINAGCAP